MVSSLPSSPPSQKSFSFKNVPRLSDSMWSSRKQTSKNLPKSSPQIFTTESLTGPFSSDPITSQDLVPEPSNMKLNQIKQRKRKGPESNPSTAPATKVMRIAAPSITLQHTYISAIQEARDLIVKAYHLTSSKEKQDAVLDLVEVFRNFTESGRVDLIKADKATTIQAELTATTTTSSPMATRSNTNKIPTAISYADIVKNNAPTATKTLLPRVNNAMKVLGRPLEQKVTVDYEETTINQMDNKCTAPTMEPLASIQFNSENVITLVTKSGGTLPNYQPFTIRENINKILG